MSVNLQFEIGHRAARKSKPSKGFTHDWELFVRGTGNNEIEHFVEKVVFNLHDSFPKPKRVVKEPPYTVKEAGYAAFLLSIEVYLKNRDEPKRAVFNYDLDLSPFKTQMNEIIISAPSEEFKRKCLKGGGVLVSGSDVKNRELYTKNLPMPPTNEIKKPAKRPEEVKSTKVFTDLFGAPIKKPDSRTLQNSSPNPTKLQPPSSGKGAEKTSSSSVSKEKSEKSKHKHSPNKDGKDSKKSSDAKGDNEKPKKDKTKDRDRSDKKEKGSKRPPSPSASSMPGTTSSSRNSTNISSLPAATIETVKSQSKQSSTPVPPNEPMSKKNSKKEKKSHEKDRERNEKKDSRKETLSKEKFELPPPKSSGGVKERDSNVSKDERDKIKSKPNVSASAEPKTTQMDTTKKQHDKESERKHKHKKKEKTKDKDVVKEVKKEKQHKNTASAPPPVKAKEPPVVKYEAPISSHLSDKNSSDSDVDSPPSIKQDSDSNSISDPIIHKAPPEIEKTQKKPRERTKAADKDDSKSRKRKPNKKDDRDSSASPPPSKMSRKDVSNSPSIHDRPSSSDSAAHHSHTNNNNIESTASDRKISNEYMSELKDLKQKITTLKNNEDLQNVVRLIASTGCYEITKSSFDFDLVQLDRVTVQRLQEFFAST